MRYSGGYAAVFDFSAILNKTRALLLLPGRHLRTRGFFLLKTCATRDRTQILLNYGKSIENFLK